ncbi:MAG: GNAT family N-acetyltransferase [Thermoleophilaceae bacterium]
MAPASPYERMFNSMRALFHVIGRSSEGAHVLELDGVMAAVAPKLPERSLPNSVVYESQEALIAALPELNRHYDEAGIDAWTVWTPEADEQVAAALRDAGHARDADPAAMTLDLADLDEPPEIEHRTGDDLIPVIAAINDRAYNHGDAFARMLAHHPSGVGRNYAADIDGEPAACLQILPIDGDASVYWVATVAEARGRGLATRLLHRALWDAREEGCDMSSLQATKLGEPVYARLGYESHGALQMWEKRR